MKELIVSDPKWYESANCATSDPELFHPGPGSASLRLAKAICKRCEVVEDCKADALSEGLPQDGVRAGMSANQRNKLLRLLMERPNNE